jgi:outer membrane protein TolC
MKKPFLIPGLLILAFSATAAPRDSLTLQACIESALKVSPVSAQTPLSAEALQYRLKNLTTDWYPTVGVNATASYNSETVDFSGIMKNLPITVPSLPLDQYKIWADLNQTLYDGGMTRARKSVEKAAYETEVRQTETDLMAVRQQVLQAYFALLATRKNISIMDVSLKELSDRKKVLRSAVDQGAVLPDNLLSMEAEELRLQQRLSELRLTAVQMTRILSVLMDTTLSENQPFVQPPDPVRQEGAILRPEYQLFDWQKQKLAAGRKLISAGDMPRLYAYGQGAYGRPGYNMISTEFHTFYSVGVGLKWNFLQYGDSKRQKKLFDIQEQLVDLRRQGFDDQLGILISNEKASQERFTEMISQDEQIIALRKEIAASAFSRLTHGIITATDFLEETDREIVARMQLETHRILRLQSAYTLLLLQGNL